MATKRKMTKKVRQELRRWGTFGVTRTLNGFVIHRGEDFQPGHGFVAKDLTEVKQTLYDWLESKKEVPEGEDEPEEDG